MIKYYFYNFKNDYLKEGNKCQIDQNTCINQLAILNRIIYFILFFFFFFFFETGVLLCCPGWRAGLFTGVILLLIITGVLTCSLSDLGRFTLPRQPGGPPLPGGHHIDAQLSADTRSALLTTADNSQAQVILPPQPPEQLGLQAYTTARRAGKSTSKIW